MISQKEKIISNAIRISHELVTPFETIDEGCRRVSHQNVCFYVNEYKKPYNKLMGQIFAHINLNRNVIYDAFSKEYVLKYIDLLLVEIVKNGIENIEDNPLIINKFDEYFQEVNVYLFLDNIKFCTEVPLKLGKFVLRNINMNFINSLSGDLPSTSSDYLNEACAEIKIFSESEKALEFAENEFDKVLDVIRYSIPFIFPKNLKVAVGLQGDITKGSRYSIVVDKKFRIIRIKNESVGAKIEFEITDAIVQIMNKIGVFKICSILEKPQNKVTAYERTLLLGIHWFANSQMQKELENEFLSLMICMEIFLTPNDERDPITTSIAEAAAIILKKEDERNKFKNVIKNFYRIRSGIVHGRDEKVDKKDVENLRMIVQNLIQYMINCDDFNTKEDLINSINKFKLSGDVFNP